VWVQPRWLSGHIELMSGTLQGLGLHDLGGEDARDKMLDMSGVQNLVLVFEKRKSPNPFDVAS